MSKAEMPHEAAPEAFIAAFDYPESHEDQAAFDAMAQSAIERMDPDRQRVFSVCSDFVRWGLWPTPQQPHGIVLTEWDHYSNYAVDPLLTDEALHWANEVFNTVGFHDLYAAVCEKRKPKMDSIQAHVRERIVREPAIQHVAAFDAASRSIQERPLSHIERLSATAELHYSIAQYTQTPSWQLRDTTTPAGRLLRRGLYRIDEATVADTASSQGLAYEKLWNFVVPCHDAGRYGSEAMDRQELIDDLRRKPYDLSVAYECIGFGAQALLADRNELSATGSAWIAADVIQALCRGSLYGEPYGDALEKGIQAAVEAASEELVNFDLFTTSVYGTLFRYMGIVQPEPLRAGDVPAIDFPSLSYSEDLFTSEHPKTPTPQKTVPRKTGPRADWSAPRYQPPRVDFSPITAADNERFAIRHTPTHGPVSRLLELTEPYAPLSKGAVDMTIDIVRPLAPHTLPYVEGYDLLSQSSFDEQRYHFAKSEGDAYRPAMVPIEPRQQRTVAEALTRIGLVSAGRSFDRLDSPTLRDVAETLKRSSFYVGLASQYEQFNGLTADRFDQLAQFVDDDTFHTQCTAAALLLKQIVDIALPGATTRYVSGNMVPAIGRHIAAMGHVQLEVMYHQQLFRLDATPSRGDLPPSPREKVTDHIFEISSPLGATAPVLPPHPSAKKGSPLTAQERVKNAATFALEAAQLITEKPADTVLDHVMSLPVDDPLRQIMQLLMATGPFPTQEAVKKTADFCLSVATADTYRLRQAGLEAYAPYADTFEGLAKRIAGIY